MGTSETRGRLFSGLALRVARLASGCLVGDQVGRHPEAAEDR
jgi:hypothetical protein